MRPDPRERRCKRLPSGRGGRFDRTATALHAFPFFLALCLILACAGCSHPETGGEEAYIGDRSVTLWSTLAQVRETVATLHYGDRVAIVERQKDQARVRTAAGVLGWTEQRNLMDAALWHRARELTEKALAMPVQARASCDKLTNVHIEPGRQSPRTYQFRSGASLAVLGRAVADYTPGGTEGNAPAATGAAAPAAAETRREDWSLVRAHDEPAGDIAGWVLRRFVRYDIPPELMEYSTQYRFVAWFELSTAPAGEPEPLRKSAPLRKGNEAPGPPETAPQPAAAPAEKPQFLVAGVQGPEGQPCDFTLIRVYTWGAARQRYETAFVESNLCGSLPIRVQPAGAKGANATFAFTNQGRNGEEHREYVMHQTSVHRVDNRRPARGRH